MNLSKKTHCPFWLLMSRLNQSMKSLLLLLLHLILLLLLLLLQVNDMDLRAASHDQAISVLRQTPQQVRLRVYRDEAQFKEEDLWDTFTVELLKSPGQGLGLSIVGRR